MSFLSFTRAERRALWVLIACLAVGSTVRLLSRQVTTPGYRLVPVQTPPPLPLRTRAENQLAAGINPNTATCEDLELLPGIGPALAARIVRHREERGPFGKPTDLLAVPGVGERLVSRITPYLRFP